MVYDGEKKKTKYMRLNFVTILVLAITSVTASFAYENSVDQRHKSIANLLKVDSFRNINGSTDDSFEKLCKLITKTLKEKYDLLMDEFEKKYNSMKNALSKIRSGSTKC